MGGYLAGPFLTVWVSYPGIDRWESGREEASWKIQNKNVGKCTEWGSPMELSRGAPWYGSCKGRYACKPNTRSNNVEIQLDRERWRGVKLLVIENNTITETP